jgi:hypothetical protein
VRGARDDVMSAEEPRTDEELKEFQLRLEGLLKELTEQNSRSLWEPEDSSYQFR